MAQAASLEQIDQELSGVLARLTQAEERLAQAPPAPTDGPVGGVELRTYQLQLLASLRTLRDTMAQEGSSVAQLRQERDAARTERDALQKQVAKLSYRVHHLQQHVTVTPPSTSP